MSGLSALQTVKIQAFLDCAKLSVLVLPDHVVSFASGAFQGCTSLTVFANRFISIVYVLNGRKVIT